VAWVGRTEHELDFCWQGNIEETGEAAMFLKTRSELVDKVIERVKALHSYEVPCIVSFPIEKGNPDYLEWIGESTLSFPT